MKKLSFGAVLSAAVFGALSLTAANAADMDSMVTKAPPYAWHRLPWRPPAAASTISSSRLVR
jgi:hypothetical protein